MTIRRRDFLKVAGAAGLSGTLPRLARSADKPGSDFGSDFEDLGRKLMERAAAFEVHIRNPH
jgi:hypothetical protein